MGERPPGKDHENLRRSRALALATASAPPDSPVLVSAETAHGLTADHDLPSRWRFRSSGRSIRRNAGGPSMALFGAWP